MALHERSHRRSSAIITGGLHVGCNFSRAAYKVANQLRINLFCDLQFFMLTYDVCVHNL